MDDIYSLVVNMIKEAAAAQGATFELLLEKGLIEEVDIKKWELTKSKHLAKLDQLQAAMAEKMAQQIKEDQAKFMAQRAQTQPRDPIRMILDFLSGNGPRPGV